jgi:DNA-binding CsgD family transcriptional regulator
MAIGSRSEFEDVRASLLSRRGRIADLRRLFERTLVPMTWVDNDRRRLDANPAARLFLRLPLAEMVGGRPDDLLPPERRGEAGRQWATLHEEGSVAGCMPIVSPDGQTIVVEYCGVANLLPGAHLFAWMPADWPADELGSAVGADSSRADGRLTAREREVLSLLATGATIREIAEELTLAHSTVKTHLRNACGHLGARNRAHALAIALRDGEIDLDPGPW